MPSIQSLHFGLSDCTKETPHAEAKDSEHVTNHLWLSDVLYQFKPTASVWIWIILHDAFGIHGWTSYCWQTQHVDAIYFAICQFSCPDIVFSELPRIPPKGIITHVLLSTLITWIFGIITLRTCVSLTKQTLVAKICAIRWTNRLIQPDASRLPTNDVLSIPDQL